MLFVAAIGITAVPTFWCALAVYGSAGVTAAAVAAMWCLLGGVTALAIAPRNADPQTAIVRLATGIAFGSAVPLFGGFATQLLAPSLAHAGLLIYLCVFYFVTLAVKTWCALPTASADAAKTVGMSEES